VEKNCGLKVLASQPRRQVLLLGAAETGEPAAWNVQLPGTDLPVLIRWALSARSARRRVPKQPFEIGNQAEEPVTTARSIACGTASGKILLIDGSWLSDHGRVTILRWRFDATL
jgi:hypothetical protein